MHHLDLLGRGLLARLGHAWRRPCELSLGRALRRTLRWWSSSLRHFRMCVSLFVLFQVCPRKCSSGTVQKSVEDGRWLRGVLHSLPLEPDFNDCMAVGGYRDQGCTGMTKRIFTTKSSQLDKHFIQTHHLLEYLDNTQYSSSSSCCCLTNALPCVAAMSAHASLPKASLKMTARLPAAFIQAHSPQDRTECISGHFPPLDGWSSIGAISGGRRT